MATEIPNDYSKSPIYNLNPVTSPSNTEGNFNPATSPVTSVTKPGSQSLVPQPPDITEEFTPSNLNVQSFNLANNFTSNNPFNFDSQGFNQLQPTVEQQSIAGLALGLIPQKITNGLQQQALTIQDRPVTVAPPRPGNFTGQIPYFLNAILSTPVGALPKGPLWVVVFDSFPAVIKEAKNYEPQMPTKWEIEKAFNTITSSRYQTEKGCILAQNVVVPGESLVYNVEGLQYNGFIRSRVGAGRDDFEMLRIGFLNTNVSIVDNVIRPWVVMTSHLGMIARPPELNYRTNISVYKLGVYRTDTPPFVLQRFNFWGACPINVGSEELTYSDTGAATIKTAEFVYQWYTTDSGENLYASGQIPSPGENVEVRRAIPVVR